tara:strand:- start:873 stop:1007 length:135 start_codon:yes stop_codon:yes gene_type:complete
MPLFPFPAMVLTMPEFKSISRMRLFFTSAMCSLSPFGFNVMHMM